VQGRGGVRVGKRKKGGKEARERGEGRKKGERGGKRGREEREREGDTCHTNPSLLPAPLFMYYWNAPSLLQLTLN